MDEKDIFGYDASENVSISKIAERYDGLSARKLNNFLGKYGVIYRDNATKSWIITDKYMNKCLLINFPKFRMIITCSPHLFYIPIF